MENNMESPKKNKNYSYHIIKQSHTGHISGGGVGVGVGGVGGQHYLKAYMHSSVHCNTIYNSQDMMLLLLGLFSRVQLCVTPWTAAYQAPPSMG